MLSFCTVFSQSNNESICVTHYEIFNANHVLKQEHIVSAESMVYSTLQYSTVQYSIVLATAKDSHLKICSKMWSPVQTIIPFIICVESYLL